MDSIKYPQADQFKYEPMRTNVMGHKVMSMWKEEQLARSLVYQHLKTISPPLACEFKVKYQPQRVSLQWKEVLSKWREDQLARNLVYNHLKLVAPSLAVEFKNKYMSWLIEQRTLIKICMSTLGNLSKHEIGNIHQNLLSSKKCLSPESSISSGEQDSILYYCLQLCHIFVHALSCDAFLFFH